MEEKLLVHVEVEKDGMKGFLKLESLTDATEATPLNISMDVLLKELEKHQIKAGINQEILKKLCENPVLNEPILCATGLEPEKGKDGTVTYHFSNDQDASPKIKEDGRVNFKDLSLIENVLKGQGLASVTLPTEGHPGFTVHGKTVPAKPGIPARVKAGRNVLQTEDGLEFIAASDGKITLDRNTLHVDEYYHIKGDVDYATGNIQFKGSVMVYGNVKSGFSIQADGDIEVKGIVEAAELKAGGNILVGHGIMGNDKASIISKGSIVSRYIQQARVSAGRDIQADVIYHSQLTAGESILLKGRRGLIVGGTARARKMVSAMQIGSKMGTRTAANVGIDPQLHEKYQNTKEKLKAIEKNLESLEKSRIILSQRKARWSLSPEQEDMLNRTKLTIDKFRHQKEQATESIKAIRQEMVFDEGSAVKAHKEINPDVQLEMKDRIRMLMEPFPPCSMRYYEGEIVLFPIDAKDKE